MTTYAQQPHLHAKAPHRAAQLIYPSNLKAALREAQEDQKKTLFGVAQGIPSVFLTKLFASAKPDCIWIDVEHGMWDRLALHDAIHAAHHHSEGATIVIVRVPKDDIISLTTALDAGADGIVIPHCESAEDVTHMMKEIYYPPLGARSFSPWVFTPGVSDASLYPNDPYNMASSNNHITVIPQIESVKGIENIDEIAGVEGVGCIMFGPGDYMADAGIPMTLSGPPDPRLAEAMGKFAASGAKYNVPLLGGALNEEMIPMMIQQGYRLIVTVFDVWGITNLVHGSITRARGLAQDVELPVATTNGKKSNEKTVVTNGS